MSNKNKKMAMWGFYLLIGVMLIFAASRTLHFVQMVMDNSIQGYMFLFATGLGSLIWLYVYLTYAEGSSQRAIAFCMTWADLAGELVLTYADMQYVGNQAGLVKMTEDELNIFFIVSVIVVGVNIVAGVFFKLSDLHAQQEQQTQDLVDHVVDTTLKELNTPEEKALMVQELLPTYRASIKSRVQHEVYARASRHQNPDIVIDPNIGFVQKEATVPAVTIPHPITDETPYDSKMSCMECGKPSGSYLYCSKNCEIQANERMQKQSANRIKSLKDEQSQPAEIPFPEPKQNPTSSKSS